MNTRKTIYDKLFAEKVELAKHEVELGLKDDILKSISDYESASKKLDNKISAYYDIIFKAKKSFEQLKADNNSLFVVVKKLISEELKAKELGKELGIDVTGAPFYKDLQSALKRYEDIQSEFTSASQLDKRIVI
jgi:hypothetical protein